VLKNFAKFAQGVMELWGY